MKWIDGHEHGLGLADLSMPSGHERGGGCSHEQTGRTGGGGAHRRKTPTAARRGLPPVGIYRGHRGGVMAMVVGKVWSATSQKMAEKAWKSPPGTAMSPAAITAIMVVMSGLEMMILMMEAI